LMSIADAANQLGRNPFLTQARAKRSLDDATDIVDDCGCRDAWDDLSTTSQFGCSRTARTRRMPLGSPHRGLLFAFLIAACGDTSGGDAPVDAGPATTGAGGHAGSSGAGGAAGTGTSGAGGNGTSGAGGDGMDASKADTRSADAVSDAPACATDGACGDRSCCYMDRCIADGQECGPGNVCFSTPVAGTSCQACGHLGQPCCAGNVCVDASHCVASPQGYRCLS
jgi:hypothetical protein